MEDCVNCVYLNDGSPTRLTRPNEGLSAVDVTVASTSLAARMSWSMLNDMYTSDHFPISITLEHEVDELYRIHPKRKWKIAKDKLSWFKSKLQISKILILVSGEEKICFCIQEIHKAAVKTFKIKFPFNIKTRPPPIWWDSECEEVNIIIILLLEWMMYHMFC